MTTLLVSAVFPPKTGGSARWFWEIYRRLPRTDYVIAAGEAHQQSDFDRTHDLRLVRLQLDLPTWGLCNPKGLRGYWRAVSALRRLVIKEKVRQLHCGRCLPEGLMAWLVKRWSGAPYVCYAHGEEMKYASASRELKYLASLVLHGAEFVIANSRNTEAILTVEWGLHPERVRVLHPGVDTNRFVPAGRELEVRNSLGWGNRPVVLTVGRLQKRKGHDTMIQALQLLRHKVPDLLYAIVGNGEERQHLEETVAGAGLEQDVQFLGELDDSALIRCYQQCDLFVLPNRQVGEDIEGFGMVLVEAQACGRPVVAGTSGGTAETMRIPDTGCVVCCDGPQELAAVVGRLLTDRPLLKKMGEAAREWAREHFDWSELTRKASAIFHQPRIA